MRIRDVARFGFFFGGITWVAITALVAIADMELLPVAQIIACLTTALWMFDGWRAK